MPFDATPDPLAIPLVPQKTSQPPVRDLLCGARALIARPEDWCVLHQGRTASGVYVQPWDQRAVQRCAIGAVFALVRHNTDYEHPALHALAAQVPAKALSEDDRQLPSACQVAIYNNASSHADVLALFDRAIAAA